MISSSHYFLIVIATLIMSHFIDYIEKASLRGFLYNPYLIFGSPFFKKKRIASFCKNVP